MLMATSRRNLLYVTISTGIGAGIILDGKLYRGACGAHPEIGHHVLDASGPACYCGSNGCWESLASGPALEARFHCRGGDALGARAICDWRATVTRWRARPSSARRATSGSASPTW